MRHNTLFMYTRLFRGKNRKAGNRYPSFTSILIGISFLFVSCDVDKFGKNFPHKPHHEQELTCDMCHEIDEERGITLPTFDACTMCHDAEDELFAECKTCHEQYNVTLEDDSIVSHQERIREFLPEGWYDVQFNHAEFLDEDTDCLGCHANIPTSEYSSEKNLPTMETAIGFNEKHGISVDCNVCHLEVNLITPPKSHGSNWDRKHGRLKEFMRQDRCLLCHQEDTCMTCHTQMKPKNHTNLWRRKTHGVHASFERESCMVCHRNDQCVSCHQYTSPPVPAAVYHTPDASCLSCHGPLAAQGPNPRPRSRFFKPMPHRMMMGVSSQKCLTCHSF